MLKFCGVLELFSLGFEVFLKLFCKYVLAEFGAILLVVFSLFRAFLGLIQDCFAEKFGSDLWLVFGC